MESSEPSISERDFSKEFVNLLPSKEFTSSLHGKNKRLFDVLVKMSR